MLPRDTRRWTRMRIRWWRLPTGQESLIAVASLVVAVVTACRFVRYTDKVTWEEANQTCTQEGMQLATIPDYEFDSSLYDTSCRVVSPGGSLEFWIGARASTTDNGVDWIDGTPESVCSVKTLKNANNLCDTNIEPGHCVWVYIQDGQEIMNLHESNCNSPRGFVCERLPQVSRTKQEFIFPRELLAVKVCTRMSRRIQPLPDVARRAWDSSSSTNKESNLFPFLGRLIVAMLTNTSVHEFPEESMQWIGG